MQKRCWSRPMWPFQSCMIIDACLQFKSWVNFRKILEGAELSIECRDLAWGDIFHLLFQHFWSWLVKSWWTAEMLHGICFLRKGRSCFGSLESPCTAFLASSSAHSLGVKSWWPGTQMSHKSITPFLWLFQALPFLVTCILSCLLISPSCFKCSFSAVLWILSRI